MFLCVSHVFSCHVEEAGAGSTRLFCGHPAADGDSEGLAGSQHVAAQSLSNGSNSGDKPRKPRPVLVRTCYWIGPWVAPWESVLSHFATSLIWLLKNLFLILSIFALFVRDPRNLVSVLQTIEVITCFSLAIRELGRTNSLTACSVCCSVSACLCSISGFDSCLGWTTAMHRVQWFYQTIKPTQLNVLPKVNDVAWCGVVSEQSKLTAWFDSNSKLICPNKHFTSFH